MDEWQQRVDKNNRLHQSILAALQQPLPATKLAQPLIVALGELIGQRAKRFSIFVNPEGTLKERSQAINEWVKATPGKELGVPKHILRAINEVRIPMPIPLSTKKYNTPNFFIAYLCDQLNVCYNNYLIAIDGLQNKKAQATPDQINLIKKEQKRIEKLNDTICELKNRWIEIKAVCETLSNASQSHIEMTDSLIDLCDQLNIKDESSVIVKTKSALLNYESYLRSVAQNAPSEKAKTQFANEAENIFHLRAGTQLLSDAFKPSAKIVANDFKPKGRQ